MKRVDEAHVIPVGDIIEHVSDGDCVCGPVVKPVKRQDGSMGWLYSHPSLDGRELKKEGNGGNSDGGPG